MDEKNGPFKSGDAGIDIIFNEGLEKILHLESQLNGLGKTGGPMAPKPKGYGSSYNRLSNESVIQKRMDLKAEISVAKASILSNTKPLLDKLPPEKSNLLREDIDKRLNFDMKAERQQILADQKKEKSGSGLFSAINHLQSLNEREKFIRPVKGTGGHFKNSSYIIQPTIKKLSYNFNMKLNQINEQKKVPDETTRNQNINISVAINDKNERDQTEAIPAQETKSYSSRLAMDFGDHTKGITEPPPPGSKDDKDKE